MIYIVCHLPRRKCIYDSNTTKYLAQTRDEVEQGDEKMKELESELQQVGLYDSDFSLGDILDEPEEEQKPETNLKKKLPEFPTVEGEESVAEYVGQYKKACISKKALLKATKERLEKDQAKNYESLNWFNKNITKSTMFEFRNLAFKIEVLGDVGVWLKEGSRRIGNGLWHLGT